LAGEIDRFLILSLRNRDRERYEEEAGREKPTITTTGYTYVRSRHGESIDVESFFFCSVPM
jgi:hypothetical protein